MKRPRNQFKRTSSEEASLPDRVRADAEKYGLFRMGDGVVMAVSGGADSMALAHLLLDLREVWKLRLTVAHLDHELRGDVGRRDCEFVGEWAESVGLPFVPGRRPVAQWAREHGASIEEAARDARYAFLAEVAAASHAEVVATGHTYDDQAETVLLRLLRGAGAAGLCGMAPCTRMHGLRLVRPLLGVRRETLLAYLAAKRLAFREDASNADRRFLRNRVRHEVLPALEAAFESDPRDRLVRAADLLRAENEWMETLTQEALREARTSDQPAQLDVAALAALPLAAQRRVVRAWLEGITGAPNPDYRATARILTLLESRAGNRFAPLGRGWRVARVYGRLMADPPASAFRPAGMLALACPGETRWPELGLRIRVEPTRGCMVRDRGGIGHWPATASIRRAAVGEEVLRLRTWQPGDRIAPSGLDGSRKVQDVFVDEKLARAARSRLPLLVCGNEIVWVPGYSVSRHWHVQNENELSWTVRIEAEG